MAQLILPLSQAELDSLSSQAEQIGLTLEELARQILFAAIRTGTSESTNMPDELANFHGVLDAFRKKLELVYQISYFYGKKMADNPAEFHAFIDALKQRVEHEDQAVSADPGGSL